MPEADKNAIQAVGRRIAESINKTRFKLGGGFVSLQVSFGASACPADGTDAGRPAQAGRRPASTRPKQRKSGAPELRALRSGRAPSARPVRRGALERFPPQRLHRVVEHRSYHGEMLSAGLGTAGHVDDQRLPPDRRRPPGSAWRGASPRASGPHGFGEPRSQTVGHRQRGLRRAVARRKAGAAGGQDQVDSPPSARSASVASIDGLVVGDHDGFADPPRCRAAARTAAARRRRPADRRSPCR